MTTICVARKNGQVAVAADALVTFGDTRLAHGYEANDKVFRIGDSWIGMGDCEDFAIAKYFSLLAVGVPASQLRLVYVRLQLGAPGGPSQAHMVLAYYASAQAEPLILDNLITDIRPASRRPDLTPVFSFNSDGLWQGNGARRMLVYAAPPLSVVALSEKVTILTDTFCACW